MLEQRRLDLVGGTAQHLGALQGFIQLHRQLPGRFGGALVRVDYLEALDALSDLDGHGVHLGLQYLP
ncbi:hypothetical protein D3C80_1836140 [compost metagenome]